jgi:hypothetical protein
MRRCRVTKAAGEAGRTAPRTVAGVLTCVTDNVDVVDGIRRLRDTGVTDLMAAPFGTPDEQIRTPRVLEGQ